MPKKAYIIVHPNNVSMPYLGRVTPYMGGIPLPDDMAATRNFSSVLEKRIKQGKAVFIYPEAHIWPYYTKIRPFPDTSFMYPVKLDTPVFCFTKSDVVLFIVPICNLFTGSPRFARLIKCLYWNSERLNFVAGIY